MSTSPSSAHPPSGADADAESQARDAQNLGRNSVLMASGTLVSRLLGMVNASLQVAVLGQAAAANAFKSANTLPNMIYVLIGAGILNAVLLPQLTKAMRRPDGGREFVDRLLTAALSLVVGVATLCTVAAGPLMKVLTSLQGPALHLGIAFALLCLPQIAFYGIFAVLGNVLNAHGSFGPFGWAPVVNNVVAIAGEIIFLNLWGMQDQASAWTPAMIWVLAGTATAGIITQCLVLGPALHRIGFRYRPRWGLRGYGFGAVGRFAAWTFLALCIGQGGGLVLLKIQTWLEPSGYVGPYIPGNAAYQNALLLFQVAPSLIAVSILTALFPQLARAWQGDDMQGMRTLMQRGLVLPAVGLIPASFAIIAMAQPMVRAIFVRLRPEEAQATGWILAAMACSTLSYAIVTLQQQYCFATEQGKTNLWMQTLLTGVQVGFALLAFIVPRPDGVLMMAIGQFVSNTVLAVVFLAYARRQLGGLSLAAVLRLYARLGLASLLGGLTAWGLSRLVVAAMPRLLGQWLACGVGAVGFVVVFWLAAWAMRIKEFFDMVRPVLRRLHLVRG